MTTTITDAWERTRAVLADAKGIAWDGCHKIYVLMDEQQMAEMRSFDYDPLLEVDDAEVALAVVQDWYDKSCGLKFVNAVKTVEGNPNDGFTTLIGQGEFEDEEILMDPNEALKNMREGVRDLWDEDEDPNIYAIEQVISSFEALDEWLSKGGFLPHDWAVKRPG